MDRAAAELVGIAPVGRGTSMSPVEVGEGYAFGVYGLRSTRASVLRLVVVPLRPGRIEIGVVVDVAATATGTRLLPAGRDHRVRLSVDRAGALFRAPSASPRGAPPRIAGATREVVSDGVIDRDDLDAARAAWYRTKSLASACQPGPDALGDVNRDGCVDVVDLQATLRVTGTNAAPAAAPTAALAAAGLTFTVTSPLDTPDASPGNGLCADATGSCTLRAAMTESNWNAGQNRIEFNLPGAAPVTIQIGSSALSLLGSSSSSVFIDGYSQPGSQPNTAQFGTNAIPGVEVRGLGNSSTPYMFFGASANNTIRGLLLSNADRPIFLDGAAANGNTLIGNWIGFNRDGSLPPRGRAAVWLNNGAHDNFIGTPALADRNVIGNYDKGIYSYGSGTDATLIQNNVLCIRPNGLTADCQTALDYDFGPKASVVGGLGTNERNVIGPTRLNGIEFSHGYQQGTGSGPGTPAFHIRDHRVIGNWIGFRSDGSYSAAYRSAQNVPTFDNGQAINIYDGSSHNVVESNYIAAVYDGVTIALSNATGNQVLDNVIGQSPLGEQAPMAGWGVYFYSNTHQHTVAGNVIRNAADGGVGLLDHNTSQVRISRNLVIDTAGPAILLTPDPGNPSSGANGLLAAPVISSVSATEASGSGLAGATVEVYAASRPAGHAGLPIAFLGQATVSGGGTWSVPVTLVDGDRITALQIATNGNTSSLAPNSIVGTTPSQAVASDAFGRTVTNGWGTADAGGAYTLDGNAGAFNVSGSAGNIVLPAANSNRAALLNQATGLEVDARVRVATDKPAAGSSAQYAYLVLRRNGANSYRPKLIFHTNGSVAVHAGVVVNNAESSVAPSVVVPGLTHTPGSFIWLRAQLTGTNPTTIQVKAWPDGQPEPAAWQFTANNSNAALQVAGGTGLRAYMGSVGNAPVTFSFDDLDIQLATPPPPPANPAADAFERAVSNGWGSADVGGSYALEGSANSFAVAAGRGAITLPNANSNRAAFLNAVNEQDIDVRVRISTDKPASGGSLYAYLVVRRNGADSYRPKLIFNTNGSVAVHAGVVVNNAESSVAPSVVVPGLTHSAGSDIWIRAQISGISPTTIRVRAWADGQPEPSSWQFVATNSQAALQGAGSVGLRAYMGSVANAPVAFSFDDYSVDHVAP